MESDYRIGAFFNTERSRKMAIRKDSKGRLLRRGETQRKDGRYCYKYVDTKGRTRCVYS
ncbi:MAG: integrase DNA-binding domain-containing protein [Slackia sp.]